MKQTARISTGGKAPPISYTRGNAARKGGFQQSNTKISHVMASTGRTEVWCFNTRDMEGDSIVIDLHESCDEFLDQLVENTTLTRSQAFLKSDYPNWFIWDHLEVDGSTVCYGEIFYYRMGGCAICFNCDDSTHYTFDLRKRHV